jgi:hypothetical protein
MQGFKILSPCMVSFLFALGSYCELKTYIAGASLGQ